MLYVLSYSLCNVLGGFLEQFRMFFDTTFLRLDLSTQYTTTTPRHFKVSSSLGDDMVFFWACFRDCIGGYRDGAES